MKPVFPSFLTTLVKLFFVAWGFFLVDRAIMLVLLWDHVHALPILQLLQALYIGAKFDMRIAVFTLIPASFVLAIPYLEQNLDSIRKFLLNIYGLLFSLIITLYAIDIGYFFYLRQRIDATLFDFLSNFAISFEMVRESYPIPVITISILAVTSLYLFFINLILRSHNATLSMNWKKRIAWSLCAFAIFFLMAYAQISSNLFPLRWSNAYFSLNKDLTLLALNPIQNLRDTAHSMEATLPNKDAVQKSYPRIAQWLQIPNPQNGDTFRTWQPDTIRKHQNVVIIIMESLSWHKTSFALNKTGVEADTTPNLLTLSQEAAYFPLCFSPTRPTARGIFTTMTGIPDVNRSGGTSSRNQQLVDQFLLMNEFQDYERFYMIGGSASWANIRGLLLSNIENLHLLEEGAWKSPNVDVWGISDLALFQEAAEHLNQSQKPFVAVIQTSGFHKPYTIPTDRGTFVEQDISPEIQYNYGFVNAKEYNSLRFADYALGEFFRLAKQSDWYEDTVFAILGDHGLNDPAPNMSPGYLACHLQGSHIPLLILAPGLKKSGLFHTGVYPQPCGQPDVFPTLARLAGVPYRYTGLGRYLFDPQVQASARQFIAGSDESFMRLVEDGYCYIHEKSEGLYKLDAAEEKNLIETEPERAQHMRQWAQNFFHLSKYLLYNNKKETFQNRTN